MGSLVAPSAHAWLQARLRVDLTFKLQRRLAEAVSAPLGVAHLAEAGTQEQLSAAQGRLTSYYPADAPAALAVVLSNRLTGLLACGVVAVHFRWWLGLALLVTWLGIRRPLRWILQEYIAAFGGEATVMRRAHYLFELATGPHAAKEVRVFGLSGWLIDQFELAWSAGMQASWTALSRYRRTVVALACTVVAVYGWALWLLVDATLQGALSVSLVSTLLPMLVMASSVGSMTFDDVRLSWMLDALPNVPDLEERLLEERLEAESERALANSYLNKKRLHVPLEGIRFESVSFRYPGRADWIISELDLTIQSGQVTALVGRNGSGKTTLVKLLAGLEVPVEGMLRVDDVPLCELDRAMWQRNCAVLFQDFNQYPASLADNITFGAPGQQTDVDALDRIAERIGLDALVDQLPAGWSTTLSARYEGGVELSGGEWQRVVLARALFAVEHGANVLVLDEPTAMLDVRGEAAFIQEFMELGVGVTTLLVSHRFGAVRRAHRICVLNEGQIAEAGTHSELMAMNGHYQRLFALQAQRVIGSERPGTSVPTPE